MRLVLCLNYKRIKVIMELIDGSDNKDDGYHLPRAYCRPGMPGVLHTCHIYKSHAK